MKTSESGGTCRASLRENRSCTFSTTRFLKAGLQESGIHRSILPSTPLATSATTFSSGISQRRVIHLG